jgi:hypothetical protein
MDGGARLQPALLLMYLENILRMASAERAVAFWSNRNALVAIDDDLS